MLLKRPEEDNLENFMVIFVIACLGLFVKISLKLVPIKSQLDQLYQAPCSIIHYVNLVTRVIFDIYLEKSDLFD